MKTGKIRELTRAEEEVMQVLWQIERGVVSQVLERFPEPKPAYNTVSTIIRILEQKGFVGHKAYGRTYEYYPLIGKSEYSGAWFRSFVSSYFGDSIGSLGSFFARDANMSLRELEELQRTISEEISKQQKTSEP
jgi:predicted transcriptional regulator